MPRPTGHQATRPVYLRLRDEIAAAIIAGRYKEGALLPSVRAYSAEQGANPLTVAKAYQQFQDDGLLEVRRGIGIAVVEGARSRLLASERDQFLTEEWPTIAERIRLLGLDMDELMARAD
ncbi:GntR family transcriptional regulator [Croceicoccus naphthovorans]|uniref:GntR family transcriptional regulator n=1 Tax=Croceicoccus naphthovorans TaxID=1348774 RepID=A0A0G3XCP8_9SPHN|nr:GntR family transcriptional regulator [Croceicoccus naphthovorans]AKM08962.1 GntR family transcriptional regulator [Croceicoccus naphthovorans]MBB3989241.1 GntR family transcriptional regulator [Croceicoccus naphthovorans]